MTRPSNEGNELRVHAAYTGLEFQNVPLDVSYADVFSVQERYIMEQNRRNVFIGKDLSCGHVAFAWQNEIIFGIFKTVATIRVVFLWKYCSSALRVRTNLPLYRDTLPPPKDSAFRVR